MISHINVFINLISTPLMWGMVVFHIVLGLVALIAPTHLRSFLSFLLPKWRIRILGLILMIIGTDVFIIAAATRWPLLVKALAVMLFIDGGVRILIPMVQVVFTEWMVDRSNTWLRTLGIVSFLFGYLYYTATLIIPPTPPVN